MTGIQGYNPTRRHLTRLDRHALGHDENKDRRQLAPTVIKALDLGTIATIVADTGYDHHEQIRQVE